jgi:hypothetical protein
MMPTTQRIPRSVKARAGEEIHVVAARDTGAQHFGRCVAGAVIDEALAHQRLLQRPDPLGQPARQGQVIAGATQQAHRGVRMRVHQARHQRVPLQLHVLRGLKARVRQRGRQHLDDAASLDGHRVGGQHGAARHHRHHPARADQGFDGLHRAARPEKSECAVIPRRGRPRRRHC